MRKPYRFTTLVALLGAAACSRGEQDGQHGSSTTTTSGTPAASEQRASPPTPSAAPHTVNEFFAQGDPTIVVGTRGDALSQRRVSVQAGLLRGLVFPNAALMKDTDIDVASGAKAWPARAVLYGGPRENTVVAALARTLAFTLSADSIDIGGEVLHGKGYRMVVVVPARGADNRGPGNPEFVIYAGTGDAGIAEINSGLPSKTSIGISDGFGPLLAGRWAARPTDASGTAFRAEFAKPRAPRIAWRAFSRTLATKGENGKASSPVEIQIYFPAMISETPKDNAIADACMRALAVVIKTLDLPGPEPISIYVHPDRRSKQRNSGNGGAGHAVPSSRMLHVLRLSPAPGGPLESLVTHEVTHLLAYFGWGPAGSALLGEGVAVWVNGRYAGTSLKTWRTRVKNAPALIELLGSGWQRLPESQKYPLAGLFVSQAIKELGLPAVRDALFGANEDTWAAACARAGSTPEAMQELYERAITPR